MKKRLSDRGTQSWLRKHPIYIVARIGYEVFAVMQVLVVYISLHPWFGLDQDTLEQLLFVSVQILTSLYGITMTGYVFFLGRIDALIQADSTFEDVTLALKKRFNHMVWCITAAVLLAFLGCGLGVYLKSYKVQMPEFVYPLLVNESLLFIGTAVVFIMYYVVNMVDPDNLRRAADARRKTLEPNPGTPGDVSQFVTQFAALECQCMERLPEALQKTPLGSAQLDFLVQQGILSFDAAKEVGELRQYYSCVLHGTSMSVSRAACDRVANLVESFSEKHTV